jgi:putative transposase
VLNELKNRDLEDVLIFSVDNLKGISEAIEAFYPQAQIQKRIVHQIRNSLRFVSWKERKPMAKDLKLIYTQPQKKKDRLPLRSLQKNGVTATRMSRHHGRRAGPKS